MEYNPETPLRLCEIQERMNLLAESNPELRLLAKELERIEEKYPVIVDLG